MPPNNVLTQNVLRRRIRWRCRRGLLELDVLLARFAGQALEQLGDADLVRVEQLLNAPDMDLLDWLEGRRVAPARFATTLERIRRAV